MCLFGVICFCQSVKAETLEQIAENSQLIEQDYQLIITEQGEPKHLALATQVIKERRDYSVDVVAQAFYLLAYEAASKADQSKVSQLLQNALELPILSSQLQANVQLNLAISYYAKAKYSLMLATIDQVLDLMSVQSERYYYALAYRAIANVALSNIKQAIIDTQKVMAYLIEHENQIQQISLFEVAATANAKLENYQLAKTLYLKKIDKTLARSSTKNLDRSYFNLAKVYKKLNAVDDAEHAYWQAMQYAKQKQANIVEAYINMGIADLALQQQNFEQAYEILQKTEAVFKVHSLPRAYLSNLMLLAKAALALDKRLIAYRLLSQAEQYLQRVELTAEQYELYVLLANKYAFLGQYKQGFYWQQQYITKLIEQQRAQNNINYVKQLAKMDINQNQMLNEKLTRQLHENLTLIDQQKQIEQSKMFWIFSCLFLGLALMLTLLKLRNISRENEYFIEDKPRSFLPNPLSTKKHYQLAFKQARQFQYPITVVYLKMMNWQDLKFHFRRKVIQDVSNNIATVINEHITDFDFAGQVSEGEYILIFPHRKPSQLANQISVLVEALKLRFFANLGSFSVILEHVVASPSAQDIDPITFMSKLAEEVEQRISPIKG